MKLLRAACHFLLGRLQFKVEVQFQVHCHFRSPLYFYSRFKVHVRAKVMLWLESESS